MFLVANYGLAGQYTVHTDAVYITGDAASKKQAREIWNIHAGDRAATVSVQIDASINWLDSKD